MSYLTQSSGDEDPVSINLDAQTEALESIDEELEDQGTTLDSSLAKLTTIATNTGTTASNTGTISTNTATTATNTGAINTDTTSIDTELTAQGLVQDEELLWQKSDRCLQEQILIQLKILTKHWEIASGEIITEHDLI